jgi:hypothetical protein
MILNKITITREKNKDIGFIIVLFLLIAYIRSGDMLFIKLSIPCILVSLLLPAALKPVAIVWYRFSAILGIVVSRMLLTAVFFCIVTPVGFVHRIISKEQLLSGPWKESRESVFKARDHRFERSDMRNQF